MDHDNDIVDKDHDNDNVDKVHDNDAWMKTIIMRT